MNTTQTRVITDNSFAALINGNTNQGEDFARAVFRHSEVLARNYLRTQYGFYREKMVGVIAIPRGGIPTAKATFDALADHETGDILYVESRIKTVRANCDILGKNLSRIKPQVVFITDGVIASGESMSRHFSAIAAAEPERVVVLSNCTTEQGMSHLAEAAKNAGFQEFEQVTGRIFTHDECQWMNIDGKKVLFVGFNQTKGIDYKLPDFGDAIQTQTP